MKNEFVLAFNEVIEEKQLPKEIILKALESAMVSAYRRAINASNAQHVEAKIDPDTGKVNIFAEKEVVEKVNDDRTEVTLETAQHYNPQAEIGMMVVVDSTPSDFGRVAAQTARQVIQQRIRDAERQAQLDFYQKQLGEIISGTVQAINSQGLTIGLDMRAEGFISRKDMIPGERFYIHDRVRSLIAEVKDNQRGPQILLSRTHKDFLRRLLENEVPEIYHGVVEIRSIAREPGERAKVAVSATQSGIDPVGACVGIRGVRIQAIVRELHDEKIDVIEWNNDPTIFIAKAISPARVTGVYLTDKSANNKTATVVVSEDQLSLAIGRDGQNARLAAKLTGWRIDIKSLTEATGDAFNKLHHDPILEPFIISEKDIIPQIEGLLAKKAEGRPLTPEEYDTMAKFVDRIEKRTAFKPEPELEPEEELRKKELRSSLPPEIFEQNILDSGLPEHVVYILQEAGYASVGDLALQMLYSPDNVLKLQGIGPRAMTEINRFMEAFTQSQAHSTEESSEVVPETQHPEEILPTEGVIVESEDVTSNIDENPLKPEVVTASEEIGIVEKEESQISDEDTPFDQLLVAFKTGAIPAASADEDEDDQGSDKTRKSGKKKHRHVEIEYDPERDTTTVRKKHKRSDIGGSGGSWDWED